MPLSRRPQPAKPVATRDIPNLYPTFYDAALRRAGKPRSEQNILALAEFTIANLALNAHTWFQALGDQAAQRRFNAQFDASTYDESRMVRVADEMIDFLWNWNRRAHPGLREFIPSMRGTIANKLKAYGDTLPLNLWQDNA